MFVFPHVYGHSRNGRLNPYMMSCHIPVNMEGQVPYKVTIFEDGNEGSAKNELAITYDILAPGQKKETFAVCMKGKKIFQVIRVMLFKLLTSHINYAFSQSIYHEFNAIGLSIPVDDISAWIVEYAEVMFELGVSKWIAYLFYVHPNILKVLKFYAKQGKLDISSITLPGPQPNEPIERHSYLRFPPGGIFNQNVHEVLIYNDCLYRNIGLMT